MYFLLRKKENGVHSCSLDSGVVYHLTLDLKVKVSETLLSSQEVRLSTQKCELPHVVWKGASLGLQPPPVLKLEDKIYDYWGKKVTKKLYISIVNFLNTPSLPFLLSSSIAGIKNWNLERNKSHSREKLFSFIRLSGSWEFRADCPSIDGGPGLYTVTSLLLSWSSL